MSSISGIATHIGAETLASNANKAIRIKPDASDIEYVSIIESSPPAGTGIKFAGNSGVAATTFALLAHIPIALTLYASCVTLASRAYDTGTPSVSVDTINSNLLCKIDGLVRNGASAGTFALRFAAETTGTVKIMTGSVMRYRQTN